jgi:hypothetical protein
MDRHKGLKINKRNNRFVEEAKKYSSIFIAIVSTQKNQRIAYLITNECLFNSSSSSARSNTL